jgi:hypothetical protein
MLHGAGTAVTVSRFNHRLRFLEFAIALAQLPLMSSHVKREVVAQENALAKCISDPFSHLVPSQDGLFVLK